MSKMNATELQDLFSTNLKSMRNRLHFSQMKLAEKANLSVGYICDLESGRRWGTPETFSKLATALGINPCELLLPPVSSIPKSSEADKQNDIIAKLSDSLCQNVTSAITKTIADTFLDKYFQQNTSAISH